MPFAMAVEEDLLYFLPEKNRYLTSAAAARTKTIITKIETSPIPHIIGPFIIPFNIASSLSSGGLLRKLHAPRPPADPTRPA
jgi:hypothetical protein